jgi:hypothetical protein
MGSNYDSSCFIEVAAPEGIGCAGKLSFRQASKSISSFDKSICRIQLDRKAWRSEAQSRRDDESSRL